MGKMGGAERRGLHGGRLGTARVEVGAARGQVGIGHGNQRNVDGFLHGRGVLRLFFREIGPKMGFLWRSGRRFLHNGPERAVFRRGVQTWFRAGRPAQASASGKQIQNAQTAPYNAPRGKHGKNGFAYLGRSRTIPRPFNRLQIPASKGTGNDSHENSSRKRSVCHQR